MHVDEVVAHLERHGGAGRRADDQMKPAPYGPFPYSPIIRPPAPDLAGRRPCRALGHSQYRVLLADGEGAGGLRRPRHAGAGHPVLVGARLRQPGRRVSPDGGARPPRHPRHGRAQQRAVRAPSRDHRGGPASAAGSGWATARATRAGSTRRRPGEEEGIIHRTLATIEKATGTRPVGWLGSGLQETWDTLDLLAAEGCEYVCDWTNDDQPYVMTLDGGRAARLDALQPRDQRQAGVRAAAPHRRRVPGDDLPAVRRALSRGRRIRARDGDRAASLSHRRAAPHRRLRRRARLHLPARAGLEGDRERDRATLSRADQDS